MLLVSSAQFGDDEKKALADVIDSGWITMGKQVENFEKMFSAMHGTSDCVAVNSCTAALHLILVAHGIGPGDEVLVPSLTFVATSNAVLYVGAEPVFVDVESLERPHMSLAEAAARCTERTKAVILVSFAGYLPDETAWTKFARERGLTLILDAAHSPGLAAAANFGDAAAFSFYGNKNMTTAEGGAVTCRDPEMLEIVRRARGHGMTSGTRQRVNARSPKYDVTMLGFNYRLDELRAAIGLVQLSKLEAWNETRRSLVRRYRERLSRDCPRVIVPFGDNWLSAYHIMPVVLPKGVERQDVIDHLQRAQIQTTIHYTPVHFLTLYRQRQPELALPRTEEFGERELTIPLHPLMSDDTVDFVVGALAESLTKSPGGVDGRG